ncbi:unnamed protein product [Phaedon cochleariae]|uniref:CRAL-TRIO domain-containing protein n=1 Tax=Phaedon cochleariae TaxID=80249 RepID=A0A9P0DAR1_PHACE|nr:unnamed protein product [Phaedon cochleariae]
MENHSSKDVDILREWLSKQPHLPKKIDDILLRRFLSAAENSIERAKYLIDLFFTIRSQSPEIFSDRDPNQAGIRAIFQIIDYLMLPKRVRNNNVFLYRITSSNVDDYDFANAVKAFFIVADARMIEEENIPDGEIPMFDMKNFSARHLTRIVFPILRKYMMYTQEAHPVRLKEIHLLNVPSFLDRVMALIRPFLKAEVAKMLHFHLPNSATLFEFIPKEVLPEEYGGTAGNCKDIKKHWMDVVTKRREYLLDESRWAVDENKRPDNNKSKELFSVQGSFKSLCID